MDYLDNPFLEIEDFFDDPEEIAGDLMFEVVPIPRGPRMIRERIDYFNLFNEAQFHLRFRIHKVTAQRLLHEIQHQIMPRTMRNNPIPAMNRLLLTLRFLATGAFYLSVGDFAHVSKTSAFGIINKVSTAIANLRPQYIKMPTTEAAQRSVRSKFYAMARFPKVIGAIDCTHVRIQSPGGFIAEVFRNRKGYFSKNVQVVAGPDLQIFSLTVCWQGSTHDQTVFDESTINRRFARGDFGDCILLGDSGYKVLRYCLPPLRNPVTRAELRYNESLTRTRVTAERLFGTWKRRFPILSTGIRVGPDREFKIDQIITSCAVMPNICVLENDDVILPPVDENSDEEDEEGQVEIDPVGTARASVRDALIADWFEVL